MRNDDDNVREAPSSIVWAVAAGTAPLPFLAVYAVLFISHGSVHPVAPPDITNSTRGELIAGIIALLLFIVAVVALLWLLNGRRRWPFAVVEVGMLATAVDFFVDVTKGGRIVSFVVALASLAALACAFAPSSWDYLGQQRPQLRRGRATSAAEAAASDDPADVVPLTEDFSADQDETTRNPQSVRPAGG